MSAEVLRRAAKLMRERAEAVTSGGQWTDGNYWITDYDPSDPSGQTAMQRLIGGMEQPDAAHYSSWHPAVALAVADWLDGIAETHESDPSDYCGEVCTDGSWWCANVTHALAVARTYLGES